MSNEKTVHYIGIVTRNGAVDDVMLYRRRDECIDNLCDAVTEGFNPETDTAQVFEHIDFEDGDQELTKVYTHTA